MYQFQPFRTLLLFFICEGPFLHFMPEFGDGSLPSAVILDLEYFSVSSER